jgi:hypothetical protein
MAKGIEEFSKENLPKQGGNTRGFIKIHTRDESKYMFKPIPKECKEDIERAGAIQEFVFGDVFKKILGEQAPEISLVSTPNKEVFMTSKFLDNFKTIGDAVKEDNIPTKIEGLEKAIITSLYLGDNDLNPGNIGIRLSGSDFNAKYTACKIDHGHAGTIDPNQDLSESLKKYYNNRDYAKQLPFDFNKARTAIKEILETDINGIIQGQITKLSSQGIETKIFDWTKGEDGEEKNLVEFTKYLEQRKAKLQSYDLELQAKGYKATVSLSNGAKIDYGKTNISNQNKETVVNPKSRAKLDVPNQNTDRKVDNKLPEESQKINASLILKDKTNILAANKNKIAKPQQAIKHEVLQNAKKIASSVSKYIQNHQHQVEESKTRIQEAKRKQKKIDSLYK